MPSLRRRLINRDYARLWYGQAVSAVGDSVFATTLVLWVSQVLAGGRSWAPAAVSGILVAAAAAFALVGPIAGVFVDRWNRKSTMMRTEVIRGAMVAGLLGLSFVPVHDLPVGLWLAAVYLVVFVLHASGQFFSLARFATTGDVVQGEEAGRERQASPRPPRRRPGSSARRSRPRCYSRSACSGRWPPTPPPISCRIWPSASCG